MNLIEDHLFTIIIHLTSSSYTYRAANEVPSKMSLTADELKSKAQPLTNTDLEIKQGK